MTLLVQGLVFPAWSDREIGIANQLMIKAIAQATGFSGKEVVSRFKKSGDFGLVIEELSDKILKAKARGEVKQGISVKTEIKAVTYHGLKIEKRRGNWVAEVIFDV